MKDRGADPRADLAPSKDRDENFPLTAATVSCVFMFPVIISKPLYSTVKQSSVCP